MGVDIKNSTVANIPVDDSWIKIKSSSPKNVKIEGSFLNNIITLDSNLNFKKSAISKVSLAIRTFDLKMIWGVLSAHNIGDPNLKGVFEALITSEFNISKWKQLDFSCVIDNFFLRKDDLKIRLIPDKNRIVIKKGNIEIWDIGLKGASLSFSSIAIGKLHNSLKLINKFKMDAKFFELLSPKISKSTGQMEGELQLFNKKDGYSLKMLSSGDDIFLKIADFPGAFSNLSYKIDAKNNIMFIREITAGYGKGQVMLDGVVSFPYFFPRVDINVKLDKSYIPFFTRSGVVVSADLSLKGNKVPYLLDGGVFIVYGEFYDAITKYMNISGEESVKSRFIPEINTNNKINFLKYNLNVDILRPIHVRNILSDMFIKGSLALRGGVNSPQLRGAFRIIPEKSRLLFKGHDFVLSDGMIEFNDDGRLGPNLYLKGEGDIDSYKIQIEVTGRSSDPLISLTSTPSLLQEDILSLLTIGVTSEISNQLKDSEKLSLTSLGLGTMLADKIGVNRGLKSALGVSLFISPEFEEDDSSLLQGKSAVSDGVTKLKTSTKIKIIKKVTNDLYFSFSRILGGSMDQRQEMNVDYNLNKNISIQGVYEMKSMDENSAESNNSAGADLRFRWSFK